MKRCATVRCLSEAKARGLCGKHYQRLLRKEQLAKTTKAPEETPPVTLSAPPETPAPPTGQPSPIWRDFAAACHLLGVEPETQMERFVTEFLANIRSRLDVVKTIREAAQRNRNARNGVDAVGTLVIDRELQPGT